MPGEDPAVVPCPLTDHWIEVELVDQFGHPVPNEEFVVVLPDGQEVRGYLDQNGWARLAPLETGGTCSVSFPNLDSTIWEYDRSNGPKPR